MSAVLKTQPRVRFTINGEALEAYTDETILQVAKRSDIEIPHLCYKDGLETDGNCRACMVEIDDERVLAPSCCRKPTEGMNVKSDSKRARSGGKIGDVGRITAS